ncbi:GIY-YIG nuclease family protein [Listeria rocourtiae]|uniref:GIY-YIG nuclease family protein n=1 Tax=Listeria rocourtiae TaxID=647910 RepID=UPI00162A7AB4|nr:GIY-YIG nuclease family protein [Listeria rocourtiae]MBC1603188.1 GIY-YIG nuclease family protein [Listeria rocourtiae]
MASEKESRKEKINAYKQMKHRAGVYRFISKETGIYALATSMDLKGIQNKYSFAQKMNMPGALPWTIADEAKKYGMETIDLEELELVDIKDEMTNQDIKEELDVLLELWKEKLMNAAE